MHFAFLRVETKSHLRGVLKVSEPVKQHYLLTLWDSHVK